MTKLNEQTKKEIHGGIGPMMLWVIIMGVIMAVQTAVDVGTTLCASGNSGSSSNNNNKSNSYTSKHGMGYMRLSPFPARSSMMLYP
jgi:hypothetical protein